MMMLCIVQTEQLMLLDTKPDRPLLGILLFWQIDIVCHKQLSKHQIGKKEKKGEKTRKEKQALKPTN